MKLSNKVSMGEAVKVFEIECSIKELASEDLLDILKYNNILKSKEVSKKENVYDCNDIYEKNRIIFNALKEIGIFNEDDKIKSFTLKCDVEEYPTITVERIEI